MKQTILLLHGWGITHNKYSELISIFKEKGFNVFSPDFPGFGEEKLQKSSYTLSDYAAFLDSYLKKNNIENYIVVAHSFGGRVIAKYLQNYKSPSIRALILSGTPLIKQKLSIRKKIISTFSTSIKKVLFFPKFSLLRVIEKPARKIVYKLLGEWDYYKAGEMQQTFKNVISESFETSLKNIHVPTLLLWGEKDTFIPLSVGERMHSLIEKSEIKVIPGSHKLPYENPESFAENIILFLKNHKLL